MEKEAVQKIVQEFMKEYLPYNGRIKVFDPTDAAAELCSRLDTICQTPKVKTTGYERAAHGCKYYVSDFGEPEGISDDFYEEGDRGDDSAFRCADYCTDRNLAIDNARADTLMRQLRRFSVEHRDHAINWPDGSDKWVIAALHKESANFVLIEPNAWNVTQMAGTPYFDTEEHCQMAIDQFKDELLWYFTEYQDTAEEF